MVLAEEDIISHLVKNILVFIQLKISLQSLQNPTTWPYREADESIPYFTP
jgi:hypothetical protein